MKKDGQRIKRRILFPTFSVLIFVIICSLIGLFWIQNQHITKNAEIRISGVEQLFKGFIAEEARFIREKIKIVKDNRNLQSLFLAKFRNELHNEAKPIFDKFKSEHNITHFYFTGMDRVNFLRVHNPSKYGDTINRFTTIIAEKEKKTFHGIEVGKFGTFTLRVVHPWVIDGKRAGYIELGMEIDHITPRIKKVLDAELFLIINKSFLNRPKWEEGLKMMGKEGSWDIFSKFAVIDQTMNKVPPALNKIIKTSHAGHADMNFTVVFGSRKYCVGFVPLIDVANKDVGDIIVMLDATELFARSKYIMISIIFFALLLSIVLFVFYDNYIDKIELSIMKAEAERLRSEKFQGVLEMAGAVCHEMNQPMQVVSGTSELLIMAVEDDSPLYENIKTVKEQIDRMGKITKKLMRITQYKTKGYLKGEIIDIDESTK